MLPGVFRFDIDGAFDALDVGVIVLDRDASIVAWNAWVERVTGIAESTVRGHVLYEVFPEAVGTRLQRVIEDAFEVGSSSLLTHSLNNLLPLHGTGGENLLHDIIVRPLTSDSEQHCLLQITDVTTSVTRERVLRERQNARYRAIVDTAPDAIITTSLDGTIQSLNGTATRIFGYEAAELRGSKIDILLDQADFTRLLSEKAVAANRTHQISARRKDGTLTPFEMSFARWKSDDRAFVTTIWRDITERKSAETALRDSEEHHRALLEALPQLVWICGPDGACNYVNPQWQSYTGGSGDDHFERRWLDALHEHDREAAERSWLTSLATNTVFDTEARLRRRDGAYRWFKIRAIPVRSGAGSLSRWFATATDITDLIEARDALLRSNEELEVRVVERTREREIALAQLYEAQKMETIGQLTGGVAHDFNNLLAVILGSLTLLKKTLPDDPRVSRLIDGAVQGAERGATLTKRLLAFARRQELKLEAVEVQKLIPDMMDFLSQSVGPNIAIKFDIEEDLPPVRIDSNQLELALMNLAVNARDAMPKGGTLTIRCRNEPSPADHLSNGLAEGNYIRLSVADTGEGMSEATRIKAMEPFFTTKGVGKGTGLGLSMVQGLTVQSGGAMNIWSEPGRGTEVTLWLPHARKEDIPVTREERRSLDGHAKAGHLRLLLVDDDSLVSMNTAYMLMDLGHSVLEAHSAGHALELLESDRHFDAVITDYAMPNMNGLELAAAIKASLPTLPVILATGYAELPANTTLDIPRLNKPYTQEQMASVLAATVRPSRRSKRGR
jgi:PAS domain S-box-containing protein